MMRLLTATFCCLLGFGITIGYLGYSGQIPASYLDQAVERLPPELVSWTGRRSVDQAAAGNVWPPRVGEPYPDLTLTNQFGEPVRLRDLQGKVILVELAAVPCKGCQAFAGGNEWGAFAGVGVQSGLGSIHEYAQRFGGVDLANDPEVVFVQLLLYGRKMTSPGPEEVGGWAAHFRMNNNPNLIVLRGTPELIRQDAFKQIPGFQLIDRDFVLRQESSAAHPETDLYRDLLPALGELARTASPSAR